MIGAGCAITPLIVRAQTATKMRRIGWLSPSARSEEAEVDEYLAPLRQLGWIEGRNIVVERRFTEDRGAKLDAAAQELVQMKVDLIVTDGTPATLAVKKATATIPIVMAAGDPVATGLVASLAHPGGNVTGYSMVSSETTAKRAALLKELLPSLQRVAYLFAQSNPISRLGAKQAETAYRSLGVRTILIDPEFMPVGGFLAEAARQGAQAVDVPGFNKSDAVGFVERAMRYHMPVMSNRDVVEAGGLVSFDFDADEVRQRVAVIIDKVLRGMKPADIPVEQPTRFHLLINLKSAKALGITVPQSILLRADEVIR
jgi:putative ABC transport system substrate-binding protein